MSKGYFTIAQGEQYQRMAYGLALSLKIFQPNMLSNLSIGVTTDELKTINKKYLKVFDEVVEIPWGDAAKEASWKLQNEWKAIYMSPYDETIKLDADMIIPANISSWWETLSKSEGVFATAPKTYRGETITSDFCRKTYTESNLPNVYSAFFYFKKNDLNYELFKLTELVFKNWDKFALEFLKPEHRPKEVSTDVAFAIAAKILDYESFNTRSFVDVPTFVHMKSQLQNWPFDHFMDDDWTRIVSTSFNKHCQLKIGNYLQTLPFHYYVKDFLTDRMISIMEKELGI